MMKTATHSASPRTRSKYIFLAAASTFAALALTGCGAIDLGSSYDKSATHEFASGSEGKQKDVLPTWVPDTASEVKEVVRSTGNERIIKMTYAGPLPKLCEAIKVQGKPSTSELTNGLRTQGAITDTELTEAIAQQHQTPLLSADWWPTGQESKTTHICGKWWVSQQDEVVSAYTPELKSIADGIISEQTKKS